MLHCSVTDSTVCLPEPDRMIITSCRQNDWVTATVSTTHFSDNLVVITSDLLHRRCQKQQDAKIERKSTRSKRQPKSLIGYNKFPVYILWNKNDFAVQRRAAINRFRRFYCSISGLLVSQIVSLLNSYPYRPYGVLLDIISLAAWRVLLDRRQLPVVVVEQRRRRRPPSDMTT